MGATASGAFCENGCKLGGMIAQQIYALSCPQLALRIAPDFQRAHVL
jgi:hypothetical protein